MILGRLHHIADAARIAKEAADAAQAEALLASACGVGVGEAPADESGDAAQQQQAAAAAPVAIEAPKLEKKADKKN